MSSITTKIDNKRLTLKVIKALLVAIKDCDNTGVSLNQFRPMIDPEVKNIGTFYYGFKHTNLPKYIKQCQYTLRIDNPNTVGGKITSNTDIVYIVNGSLIFNHRPTNSYWAR